MKIKDVLHHPDTITNLIESFDYIPGDLTWDGDIGNFSINNEKFSATITPADKDDEITYSYFFNPVPKVGNVDFWMDGDAHIQDTTGLMKSSAFKVFAAVARVISELKRRYGYEVLLCAAKREHSPTNFDNRVRAYEVITSRIAKNTGLISQKISSTEDGVIYVLFKQSLYHGMMEVKNHLEQYHKQEQQ